ncbi:hypothetical protein ABZ883_24910 [Streptomyces sp. NPDC046977]|uniref:hypothetical protein n=1 Tax=Streptomyces sp. NPDC046977 TaxID=3154703 RepID=UPI0033CFBB54
MYLHEMLGRARTEELLREAEEFRLAHAARQAAREAARETAVRRAARRGGTEAAPDDGEDRPGRAVRRGRRPRRLGAAG